MNARKKQNKHSLQKFHWCTSYLRRRSL